MKRRVTLLCVLVTVVLNLHLEENASATTVVWESGTLAGTNTFTGTTTTTVTGSFTLNPGVDGVPGLDYSSASPGVTNSNTTATGPGTGIWSGTFQAPSIGPQLIFTVTSGVFSFTPGPVMVGQQIPASGPLSTLIVNPPLAPFPSTLTNPFFSSVSTVTQVHQDQIGNVTGFDFVGTYSLSAQVIPEPVTALLVGCGLAGIAVARRRNMSL